MSDTSEKPEIEELLKRIRALEDHVFGDRCEACGQFEKDRIVCEAPDCENRICKCNVREDDILKLCGGYKCVVIYLDECIRTELNLYRKGKYEYLQLNWRDRNSGPSTPD